MTDDILTPADRTFTDSDGDALHVDVVSSIETTAGITADTGGVYVTKDQAPDVALAILVNAGYTDGSSGGGRMEHAVGNLAAHIKRREEAKVREAEEAEARAKLDAEALVLVNASRASDSARSLAPLESLDELPFGHVWRDVAKAARKLHKTPEPRFQVAKAYDPNNHFTAAAITDTERPTLVAKFGSIEAADRAASFLQDDPEIADGYYWSPRTDVTLSK